MWNLFLNIVINTFPLSYLKYMSLNYYQHTIYWNCFVSFFQQIDCLLFLFLTIARVRKKYLIWNWWSSLVVYIYWLKKENEKTHGVSVAIVHKTMLCNEILLLFFFPISRMTCNICWVSAFIACVLFVLACFSHIVRYYLKFWSYSIGSILAASILPIPVFILRPRDYRNAL